MKLHRDSAESGDFSGPMGEIKNRFLNRTSSVIGARSSRLHEICGLGLPTFRALLSCIALSPGASLKPIFESAICLTLFLGRLLCTDDPDCFILTAYTPKKRGGCFIC
jgi:hypothetical protein